MEEEEPALHIVWEEAVGEIHAQSDGRSTDRSSKTYYSRTVWSAGGIVDREDRV